MDSTHKPDIFLAVIQTNKGIIYKVANAYCKSAEDRKDLVQEIIVQVWKSFSKYTDRYKYTTWIYRIALNTAISFYRRENRRKHVLDPMHDNILDFAEANSKVETDENIGLLQEFISELKALDKALILLYLEEKDYKEIAEIMGISATNVSTKVARIKIALKQKFSSSVYWRNYQK